MTAFPHKGQASLLVRMARQIALSIPRGAFRQIGAHALGGPGIRQTVLADAPSPWLVDCAIRVQLMFSLTEMDLMRHLTGRV